MDFSETVKAIHALACLRHFDVDPARVGVVLSPAEPPEGPQPSSPDGSLEGWREKSETCHWHAMVRLGGGKWGHIAGAGATPEEALSSLLRGWLESHGVVNQRRAAVFGRLPALRQHAATLRASAPPEYGDHAMAADACAERHTKPEDVTDTATQKATNWARTGKFTMPGK